MSENQKPEMSEVLKEKNKLYEQLVFIYQVLNERTQYFIPEFEVAKDSLRTITKMANELKVQIDNETPKAEDANEQAQAN